MRCASYLLLLACTLVCTTSQALPREASLLQNHVQYLTSSINRAETCVRQVANTKLPQVARMITKLGQVHAAAERLKTVIFFVYDIVQHLAFGLFGPFAIPLRNEFNPMKGDIQHILNQVKNIYIKIRSWGPALLRIRGQTNAVIDSWKKQIKEILHLGRNITTNAIQCLGVSQSSASNAVKKFGAILAVAAQLIDSKEIDPYKKRIEKALESCEKLNKQELPNVDDKLRKLFEIDRKLRPVHNIVRRINSVLNKRVCIPDPIELAKIAAKKAREIARKAVEKLKEAARRIIRPRIRIRFPRFRRWGKRRRRQLDEEIDKTEAMQFLNRDKRSLLCVSVGKAIRGGGKLLGLASKLINKLIGRSLSYRLSKDVPRKLKDARRLIDQVVSCVHRLPIRPSDVTSLLDHILSIQLPLQCPRDVDRMVYSLCVEKRILTTNLAKIKLPQSCENLKVYIPPQIKTGLQAFKVDFAAVCPIKRLG